MKYSLQANIKANIIFTDQEFDLIEKDFKSHYDYLIREACEVGGWLYGFKNRRQFAKPENAECDLSFRQVDTILKALESDYSSQAIELFKKLHNILSEINMIGPKINDQLKAK